MVKRFSDLRGDAGVLDHPGWKRTWVMISGGIFVLMAFLALGNPNVVNVSIANSSLDCVPGTYSESTGQPEGGFYQPAQAQGEDGAGQIVDASPSAITSVNARAGDERRATRDGQITTFTCTSYLGLIFAFVAAAFLSIGIAIMFRLARWFYGFRKN
jgi:hypothetical protein